MTLLVIIGTVTTIAVAILAAVEVKRMDQGKTSLPDHDKTTDLTQ